MKDTDPSTDNKPGIVSNIEDSSSSQPYPKEQSPCSVNKISENILNITDNTNKKESTSAELHQSTSESLQSKQTMLNKNNSDIGNNDFVQKPRKHLKLIVMLVILIIILPSLTYGIIKYNDSKAIEYQESLDFAVLCEENYNIEDYQTFLDKYPESHHLNTVNNRLTTLKEMASNWAIIKDSKNSQDFSNFKNRYNDSHYNRLCNLKLDSIDWSSARESNTPDAYEAYIKRNPNGLYVSEAIIAKGEVGYMNLTHLEISNICNACNQLFSALDINNTDSVTILLSSELETFLQLETPSLEDVIQWMISHPDEGISYVIKDSIQSQRAYNEEKGISYISNVNLEKVATDSQGNKIKEPCIATIKQNRKFKIYSFTVKKL